MLPKRLSGILIIWALLLVGQKGWAQTPARSQYVVVNGFTLNGTDLQPIASTTVVNKRSRMGTISGENGYFSISGLQGDTISFTAIGFMPFDYVVPAAQQIGQKTLQVVLQPRTYELSEVLILPYSEEQFKKDVLALKLPEEKEPQINLPAIVQPGLSKDVIFTGNGVAIQGPLSALYNKFSRRGKELREVSSLRSADERQRVYKAKLNPEFVSQVTGLKDEALTAFMSYCHPAENFVLQANEYDLVLALQDCLKSFTYPVNQGNN